MFKKLMAILIVALLMLSCVGTAVMADGETVSVSSSVVDEVLITKNDPNTRDNTPEKKGSAKDGSAWYCYTMNSKSSGGATVLQKFDISSYSYPIVEANLRFQFKGSGDFSVMIFKAPSNWNSSEITWNTFNGDTFDFSKNGVNHIKSVTGTDSTVDASISTTDITDYVNEALLRGDDYITVCYGRDVPVGSESENTFRVGAKRSKLIVTKSEPVYNVEPKVTHVPFSDVALISKGADLSQISFSSSWGWFYKKGDYVNGIANSSNSIEPYGISRCHYIKFDVSNVDTTKPIKRITLTYQAVSRYTSWSVYHYLVEDDSWKGKNGTGTQVSNLMWDDVFPEDAETGEVKPTNYAPNKDKYIYNEPLDKYTGEGAILNYPDNDNVFMDDGPFDVTDLVKDEFLSNGGDGTVSLAIMVKNCYYYSTGDEPTKSNNRGTVRIRFIPVNGPHLNIEYDDGGEVTSDKEDISFKINNADAETLTNGVFKAETEITNTMLEQTTASLIMCVYENNKLKDVFVKTTRLNNRYTNNGKTIISVSSGKEIEVNENTKVGVYLWKDLLFPIPVNSGKVITAQ